MMSQHVTNNQFPVGQLQQLSLLFPDPVGSLNNMKRTFSTLLSVTKKTAQKIFIQDLIKCNLQTKNTEFVVRRLIHHSKSQVFQSMNDANVAYGC